MFIIKLDAIDSTNSYLRASANVSLPKDFTVVWSDLQTEGRGQMGTQWQSQGGKNLTFSVFKRNTNFNIEERFVISMLVSLAIYNCLRTFQIPKLKIKWPNDILAEEHKICGILIENIIKNNALAGSVIGIGLNVNQRFFDDLPRASSMYSLTGKLFDRDEVLTALIGSLKQQFEAVDNKTFKGIKKEYESHLFRFKKPSTFRALNGETITGIIKGVTQDGQLRLLLEDDKIEIFDFKELTLLY
ncbi:biotin--[acetyl-CoA-carboxylase] ligase [uncultured Winogradskyella sp.]|uniref:biotin--[acetyl-CoA-carboxylase] ligase n=1 Tax=uncultured Winogradskyella sp. TaxID=395353 RepID=UPI0035188B64